jgi:hypothetical protein
MNEMSDDSDDDELEELEIEDLPKSAFQQFEPPTEFHDAWLRTASKSQQLSAMRIWFGSRFCDPAHETSYNSAEGGYLFTHGGPFDPGDELPNRFSGIVDDDLVQRVVDEMIDEVGDEWAPAIGSYDDREDEADYYQAMWELETQSKDAPIDRLRDRIANFREVMKLNGDPVTKGLARQLVYGAAIGALEAFLWETIDFWVTTDPMVLRRVVTNIEALSSKKMTLGEVYKRHEGLLEEVKGYLQNLVWHRWERVKPLFEKGLGISMPSVKPFVAATQKRHDIVHRSGQDKQQQAVVVTEEEVNSLLAEIEAFCQTVSNRVAEKLDPHEF